MTGLRILLRNLSAAFPIAMIWTAIIGGVMLARGVVFEPGSVWVETVGPFVRLMLAEAGLVVTLVTAMGCLWIALAAPFRFSIIGQRIATLAQTLVFFSFMFLYRYSTEHYGRTGSFVTIDELRLAMQDFAFLVVEIETGIGQFLPLVATALVISVVAHLLLSRGATRNLDAARRPIRLRSTASAAASLIVVLGAWTQIRAIEPGRFARLAVDSSPELRALIHAVGPSDENWVYSVRPEDLDLQPRIPVAEYLSAAAPPPNAKKWNLIIVELESMGARRLDLHGASNGATPRLDALARESLVFNRTMATSTSSSYAQLAVLSSQYPLKYFIRDRYTLLNYPRTLFWDVLAPLGYDTAIFSSQDERWNNMSRFLRTPGLKHFFHSPSSDDPKIKQDRTIKIQDRYTLDRFLEWMPTGSGQSADESDDRPFAAYLNFQGTHFPYGLQPGCEAVAKPATIDFPYAYLHYPPENVDVVLNVYRNAMRCVDAQIGRLVDELDARGLSDRTLLVITGDHGESFFEHNRTNHGYTIYEEVVAVPMLWRAPGLIKPGRFRQQVSHLDVLPSVFALMGFRHPHPNWQGVDVLAPSYRDRNRPFFASVQYARNLSAVLFNGKKLIRNISTGDEEFFDLRLDPAELRPLQGDPMQPRMRRGLLNFLQRQFTYYAAPALTEGYYPPAISIDAPARRFRIVGEGFNFESGRFAPNWTPSGKAFGPQPATNNIIWTKGKKQNGAEGVYFAASFFLKDHEVSELRSKPFLLEGDYIRLKIGGVNAPDETYVALIVEGQIVHRATGLGNDGLNPVWWDVKGHRGKTAEILIHDELSELDGHILVDDIRQMQLVGG